MSARGAALGLSASFLVACRGASSALDPAGPYAAEIAGLTWYFVAMAAFVLVAVTAALAGALLRQNGRTVTDRALTRWVVGAVAVTVVILLVNLVVDLGTNRSLAARVSADPLTIRVTGHQWWWELEYRNAQPSRRLTTANEMHIPAGEPVLLELESADVIHSFWVPRLNGKRDLIPGHAPRRLWIQADEPGRFRGSCAEFCGHQHAHMGIVVVAETPEDFARWYDAQLAPAAPPADPRAADGERIFLTRTCPVCHTVRGTPAGGRTAPDLTHVASRGTIAAGRAPNTPAFLGSWIADPHALKPGVRMPQHTLPPHELEALLAYLGTLR